MIKTEIITHSLEETENMAQQLARQLKAGDVITLEGDLGAGKTTFTKGVAKGLDITETVTSPTFTIIKQYEGRLPLYHMDVYRLEYSDEDIGFDEYFYGNGISIVEWASFIEEYLPDEYLHVSVYYMDETTRKWVFQAYGKHYENMINMLEKE